MSAVAAGVGPVGPGRNPAPIPAGFAERLAGDIGKSEAEALLLALERPPLTGLRVRSQDGPVSALLAKLGWQGSVLPWSPAGARLEEIPGPDREGADPTRHPATVHPWQDAGAYYLQDPSAMGVVPVLDPRPGERILDLAAAPGGKSTYIADLLGGTGLLWSHDVEPRRVDSLVGNLERWGAANTVVSQGSLKVLAPLRGWFDRVLLDAPCSGEGLFRKSEAARRLWSPARVAEFTKLQAELLDAAVELLRPGGVLVYSTCTFGTAENEGQVSALLARRADLEPEAITVSGADPGLDITGSPTGLEQACARWWPHRQTGEGHFVARLRRRAGAGNRQARANKHPQTVGAAKERRTRPAKGHGKRAESGGFGESVTRADLADFAAFAAAVLGDTSSAAADTLGRHEGRLRRYRDQLWLVPTAAELRGITPRRAGAPLGYLRRGRFEPHHALSRLLADNGASVSRLDLDLEDPRLGAYLHGEPLQATVPDGWLLVRAAGLALGWSKAKGGELNNHFPRGLRH